MKFYKIAKASIFPGKTAFDLYQTHGLPIDILAMIACECRFVIGWNEFLALAIENGWNPKRAKKKIFDACIFAGYNDEVMQEIENEYLYYDSSQIMSRIYDKFSIQNTNKE